jgi:hypothetical protein
MVRTKKNVPISSKTYLFVAVLLLARSVLSGPYSRLVQTAYS